MTWNAARGAQKDDARATVWRKVRYFDGPGHHWGLDWVIFRSFLRSFQNNFGIQNRKNAMSKDDRMKPGSQTPPWDALGSILGSFWVDFGHRFWTKKPLKNYEEACSPKICKNTTKMTSKLSNKSIR